MAYNWQLGNTKMSQWYYIATDWKAALEDQGIIDFEVLWRKLLIPVDAVNYRRGGMSSVGKLVIANAQGQVMTMFIKRHDHHLCRNPWRPWQRIPTLRREYCQLRRFANAAGWSVPNVIFYAECRDRAILGLQEITGAIELGALLRHQPLGLELRQQIARAIAAFHAHRWQHSALYPKHIFINPINNTVSFIDLEGVRRRWVCYFAMLRDLDSLNRHVIGVSVLERARFLKAYLHYLPQHFSFTKTFRKLWQKQQSKNP